MAKIRIDAEKAERMIAQIFRDEKGLLPVNANAAWRNSVVQPILAATVQ